MPKSACRFEAAHLIPGLKKGHKCGRLHGHSWVVKLEFGGEVQDDGMVIDFGIVSEFFAPILDQLDHRYLNDFIEIPTSENVAIWIYGKVALHPIMGSQLLGVTVEETCTSGAVYYGQ